MITGVYLLRSIFWSIGGSIVVGAGGVQITWVIRPMVNVHRSAPTILGVHNAYLGSGNNVINV